MFARLIGKLLAYAAMLLLLLLGIAFIGFFVECASWGQCPRLGGGSPAQHQASGGGG
ncbi:MAG: hypothetical protein JO056_05465 [Alphaproteobacteria bacterium]|nr:hypothetical protein [Alphaproteobacteria bacterium]